MNWLRQKWLLARQKPYFWGSIFLCGVCFLVVFVWPASGASDFRVRTLGMVLQLIGLATVWIDLTKNARAFGKPGILAGMSRWLKTLVFGRDAAIGLSAIFSTASTVRGRLTVRHPIPSEASLLERISAVERNISEIDKDLGAAFSEIENRFGELQENIKSESNERSRAVGQVASSLETTAIGNFSVLAFGALWLAIGVILATWSPEIAKTIAGQWSQVVKTL